MKEGKRVNNVRSSESDLTHAALIFREHERQKPLFSESSIDRWTSNTTTRVSKQLNRSLTTQTFKEVLWAVQTLHLVKAVDSFWPSIDHASASSE